MKNRICKRGVSGLYRGAAFLVLSAQLSTVSILPGVAQTSSQPMFNDSLPLPELNIGQLERTVKGLRSKKTTAAVTPAAPATPAKATTATATAAPPRNINAGTLLAGSAPQDAGRLSASDDWIEDSLIMRQQAATVKPAASLTAANAPASAASPSNTATPATTPSLRAPIAATNEAALVPATTAANQAPATTASSALAAPEKAVAATTEAPAAAPTPAASKATTAIEAPEAAAPEAATTASTTPAPADATAPTATDAQASPLEAKSTEQPADAVASENASPAEQEATATAGKSVAMLTPELAASTPLDGVIVIDNDEASEQNVTIEFEELPTDASGAKVRAGARFPIVITSEITSKTAKVGDPVHGRLKYDLKIKDRLIAEKGAVVRGHINYALKARTPLASLASPNRWYKDSGCLGIAFDEVINSKNEHIPLVAEPAKQAMFVKNKGEGRELGINHKGQIAGQWSQQLKYKAVRIGLNFALAPTGVFSFGAMPVALGVIGAANPSFAFMKPVGTNVRHRRIKGFFWGALSGVPGSWLIEDTTVKGNEAIIKPGDEFLAEMRKEFTGDPAPEAQVAADTDLQVQAELIKKGKKKSKKQKS